MIAGKVPFTAKLIELYILALILYKPLGTTGKVATIVKFAVVESAGIVIVIDGVEPIRVGNAILLNSALKVILLNTNGEPVVLVIEYTTLTVLPTHVVSEAGAIGEVLTIIACP